MGTARNFFLALLLVAILAAPIAVCAAALRGLVSQVDRYNTKRALAVADRVRGGMTLGDDQEMHLLRYLAAHPEAARTLQVDPEQVIGAGPKKELDARLRNRLDHAHRIFLASRGQ